LKMFMILEHLPNRVGGLKKYKKQGWKQRSKPQTTFLVFNIC